MQNLVTIPLATEKKCRLEKNGHLNIETRNEPDKNMQKRNDGAKDSERV